MQEGSQQAGLLQEGSQLVADLQGALQKWRLQRLLSGPFDRGGAVVSVQVSFMRSWLDLPTLSVVHLPIFILYNPNMFASAWSLHSEL